MPDFKEMYLALFRETTKAIQTLQIAQQQTEKMYIEDDTADNLILITQSEDNENQPPQE